MTGMLADVLVVKHYSTIQNSSADDWKIMWNTSTHTYRGRLIRSGECLPNQETGKQFRKTSNEN